MRKFGKSIITFTIILSPILIMGRPIVGSVDEDYYSILGLNENSSLEEVYQAFYILSEKYGPDVTNNPSAQMRFQKIKEAFDVLSDVVKRRQYDYQRRLGNYQSTMNFGFPTGNIFTGDFPFGPQYADGHGGNAYAWTSGNAGGANNYAWGGTNGWGMGNGMNGNFGWNTGNGINSVFAWGGQGGGNYGGSGGGAGSGSYGGSGGNTYGNGGSAWVVGAGDNGAAAWAAGGNGGAIVGGKGGAATVSGGGGGEATYESYTINGCTTVTRRMGDSVATYTTCE